MPWGTYIVNSLYYYNAQLFACTYGGLYVSTDLGRSWTLRYGTPFDSNSTIFRDIISYEGYLIAAIDFNSIYISSDDGVSWTDFNEGLNTDWTFVALAINPPYIWALRSDYGNAYRRPLTQIGN